MAAVRHLGFLKYANFYIPHGLRSPSACDVHDIIMYAKFHVEILMGYDFTGGRISHFPIDFCMGLTTVQRKGTACNKLKGEGVPSIEAQTRVVVFNFLHGAISRKRCKIHRVSKKTVPTYFVLCVCQT